ncbi:MAG: hypothetical protein KatS3mg131_2698 [Candidatus Tectimicrobiota bacterium]|nr:MAG: hypothetical protein KatS3mg131_2698 [Candidatus Tectomicrobia bacterium]
MVLPGYALMAQGTQIHVAAWPGPRAQGSPQRRPSPCGRASSCCRVPSLPRPAATSSLPAACACPEDTPERYRELATFYHTGDSCIIDPRGEILAGPVRGETLLTAQGSLEAVYAAKARLRRGRPLLPPGRVAALAPRAATAAAAGNGACGQPG